MSEVKDVRSALERLGQLPTPEDAVCNAVHGMRQTYMLAQAIVSEGLAACDAMPPDRITGGCCYQIDAEARLGVFSAILRKAGLLQ